MGLPCLYNLFGKSLGWCEFNVESNYYTGSQAAVY